MQSSPRGMRLHIGIFGRRNVGKSSLLNAITSQNVSIVSEVAGTTTDPVEKPMELLPLGPVLFIDTAGLDEDEQAGKLGEMRVERTRHVFDRTELALLVLDGNEWGPFEEQLRLEFQRRGVPLLVVFSKCDCREPDPVLVERVQTEFGLPSVFTSTKDPESAARVRRAILECVPEDWIQSPTLAADLVQGGDTVVLVIPIDKEAPKGRLILPQVQVLRELLDHGITAVVTRDSELAETLGKLKNPPALVITDSQAFQKVNAIVPREVPLTGFSVLFARFKGDLRTFIEGTQSIANLKPGANVLIAETCSHHPIGDDIGRVKIPNWLEKFVGGKLNFQHTQGHDFPPNLKDFDLVIQCGGCMTNRREILSRIMTCRENGVPITNYGMVIAFSLGIFERAVEIFR